MSEFVLVVHVQIKADAVIQAVGRRSNGALVDPAAAGVAMDDRGVIVVDKSCRTNVEGIFAISDAVAFAIIKELEKRGKRVPEDVKVIGFDGGRSFLNSGKRITSIGQSPKEIAKALRNTIINLYEKKEVTDQIVPIYYAKGDTL